MVSSTTGITSQGHPPDVLGKKYYFIRYWLVRGIVPNPDNPTLKSRLA